ncbi:MAG: carbamate kinase [Firmicutes bacterium]|uniref:Carbamate kinase n=1 Tax=Candidatus Scybalomonas excrementavium TaxID=2840943 RepID=A0A9D9I0C9_9FIRM|nr:carbamate kinase [Candidatus Scybalomonas excrementavium]
MVKKKVVVALGHSALGVTLPEQMSAVKVAAQSISDLVEQGYQVVISHSNGPQVGMIHRAMNEFGKLHGNYTNAPMSVCSAMSQGYIGYDLQNAIHEELLRRGIFKTVVTVITQVAVDPYDDAFFQPTKTIGRILTEEEAEQEKKKGNHVVPVEGGFQRIIAAPEPKEIVEIDAIRSLVDAGHIVIACGGGGIPVLRQDTHLKGASAVIEKDLTSSLLADCLDADDLMILSGIEYLTLHEGCANEEILKQISVQEAKEYVANKSFPKETTGAKLAASITFVENHENRRAIITELTKALDGIEGKIGTIITNN